MTATCATAAVVAAAEVVLFVPDEAGVLGAWVANSSCLVLVVLELVVLLPLLVVLPEPLLVVVLLPLLVVELLEVLPLDEPLALNEPVRTIAPPVTLIEPVDPPVVDTEPPTVTAWAVAVI